MQESGSFELSWDKETVNEINSEKHNSWILGIRNENTTF